MEWGSHGIIFNVMQIGHSHSVLKINRRNQYLVQNSNILKIDNPKIDRLYVNNTINSIVYDHFI